MFNESLKNRIHSEIVRELDPALLHGFGKISEAARVEIKRMIIEKLEPEPLRDAEKQELIQDLLDDVIGYGPITPLLNDGTITEVMVNGAKQIFYETKGKLRKYKKQFTDDTHIMRIIERIVAPVGRRIDESTPMVDARLPDGSRVNAIIPPLSLVGPVLTIRKFATNPYTIDDLVSFGTLTPQMAELLNTCIKARLNILISGGTGSGKTTTLNVLSGFIPDDERIVTIEDAAELQLRQEHVVTLESRPPNIEGRGEVTIRDLVRNSLRMRPDRIIIGEVRSGEALDMLQAMNTGHDGSLVTCHANSPRDALARLETMTLMAGMDLPSRAIREQMASAIHLIIHQARLRDGSRRITHITEVVGMEGQRITLQDIFIFEQTGIKEGGIVIGHHVPTGIIPSFLETIKAEGLDISRSVFFPEAGIESIL
ncbi:CpaF family protein [bacterium]|nr:CpaF family protein [bacterium]